MFWSRSRSRYEPEKTQIIIIIIIMKTHGLMTKPTAIANKGGILNTPIITPPATRASTIPGTSSRRTATAPTFLVCFLILWESFFSFFLA